MNQLTPHTEDELLVAGVREAVASSTPPEALAARVGRKPAFDTTTGQSIELLRRIDLVEDPEHPVETFARNDARTVVYWIRPLPSKNPQAIGVQVGSNGKPRVFFGIVMPP